MAPRFLIRTVLALSVLAAVAAHGEQAYPNRPITLVVAVQPGGSADRLARALARFSEKRFGQPVVVDYKPGGGTNIGTDFVAHAKPDGYTLLMAGTPVAVNPSLYKTLSYKLDDLAPVTLVSSSPYLMVVSPKMPVKTLPEFIAYAKSHPGKINFASAGLGSGAQLAGALMNIRANIDMNHIPYKGTSQALTDVMSDNVHMTFTQLIGGAQLAQNGRLRALAVTSLKRSKALPDVPTVAEQGFPGYEMLGWYGIMVPRGVPPDIIKKLNEVLVDTLHDPEAVQMLEVDGVELIPGTPQEFGTFLRRAAADAAAVVKATGATAD